jgi:hypothetical protein
MGYNFNIHIDSSEDRSSLILIKAVTFIQVFIRDYGRPITLVELAGSFHLFYLVALGLRTIEVAVVDKYSVVYFLHILQLQLAVLEFLTFTLD